MFFVALPPHGGVEVPVQTLQPGRASFATVTRVRLHPFSRGVPKCSFCSTLDRLENQLLDDWKTGWLDHRVIGCFDHWIAGSRNGYLIQVGHRAILRLDDSKPTLPGFKSESNGTTSGCLFNRSRWESATFWYALNLSTLHKVCSSLLV